MPLHDFYSIIVLPYMLFTTSLPRSYIARQQNHFTSLFCILFSCRVISWSWWQLFIFPGSYLHAFIITGWYAELIFLLWQCDSSSTLSQSILSSLLQLHTSTFFNLSIVSMMSLHSTSSCLETLHILWWSPCISSSYLVDTITPLW